MLTMIHPPRQSCDGVNCAADCHFRKLAATRPDYVALWNPSAAPRKWPRAIRAIGKLRAAGDQGIGDTIARHLTRFGADALKSIYRQITGTDCGCSDRQAALNWMFPYA